jgi:hypothetical protein
MSGSDVVPDAELFPYIYVNVDGTARDLHSSERQYLQSDFCPGDGAAPYIKGSYSERNGWGELAGYLERSQLPHGTEIQEAPIEDPRRSLNKAELVEWLRSKGMEITEKSDGSFVTSKSRR